jgi:hypothetical protein
LSLILREEHRLRVFENRDGVKGEWRKIHNEVFAKYNWNVHV